MARKHPVPSPDEVPSCFGSRFREADPRCVACHARAECSRHTAAWSEQRSLSEHVADLASSLTSAEPESAEAVYTRLFRETFGKKPFIDHERHRSTIARVAKSCADQGIDLETYIAGNLWAMKRWAEANPRIGFQPTHLSGENALRRYHAYLGRLSRRFRHAKHEATAGESPASFLRRQLFLGEYAVAEHFVAAYVASGEADWKAAVLGADPNQHWLALEERDRSAYQRACGLFGTSQYRREREFARLRAAAALAETYQHGLADRIGFTSFEWADFAKLVRRIVGAPKPTSAPDLAEVPGVAWH